MERAPGIPVSIVVDNYQSAPFVGEAIDSALAQEGIDVEVIVVDDGSTDGSREVIEGYGDRVTPLFKENGGQGSALNAGFAESSGDVVIFLDGDDRIEPWAAGTAAEAFQRRPDAARLHWPLRVIDAAGAPTGEVSGADIEEGDLCARVLSGGPYAYRWASTSGNAWPRRVLDRIMPMDEVAFFQATDNYLAALAPLYGPVLACEPMSCWREHSSNYTAQARPFDERLEEWVMRFDAILAATEDHAARLGLEFDREAWLAESWYHRVDRAAGVIAETVPAGVPVVLLDEDSWAVWGSIRGYECLPFPQWRGRYAGPPASVEDAVAQLDNVTRSSASAFAVAWSAFWWLDDYGLRDFLTEHFDLRAETPDVQVYLRRS